MSLVSMPSGRYKGVSISKVPTSFLSSLQSDSSTQPWLIAAIDKELEGRLRNGSSAPSEETSAGRDMNLLSRKNMWTMDMFANEMDKILWNKDDVERIIDFGVGQAGDQKSRDIGVAIKKVFGFIPFGGA